jgi:septum site-determining protein MinD
MLAIAGGKGGVGKTTTALGLGRALAARRRRPLAVDADADMPDLHVLAEVPAEPGVDAVADGTDPGRVRHPSGRWPGVSVCPATPGASVGRALDRLRTRPPAGPVLVDCPGGAGPDATAPLRRADRVLVVTTPDRTAVTDAAKTASVARALETPVAGVVVTETTDPPDGVADAVDAPVVAAVPRADRPLGASDVRAAYGRLTSAVYGAE